MSSKAKLLRSSLKWALLLLRGTIGWRRDLRQLQMEQGLNQAQVKVLRNYQKDRPRRREAQSLDSVLQAHFKVIELIKTINNPFALRYEGSQIISVEKIFYGSWKRLLEILVVSLRCGTRARPMLLASIS